MNIYEVEVIGKGYSFVYLIESNSEEEAREKILNRVNDKFTEGYFVADEVYSNNINDLIKDKGYVRLR